MSITDLAPIVLFTYNRPWHTEQTINALLKNELASKSVLIVYADGAKNELDVEHVQSVRSYLKTITGFHSIRIIERDKNYGLGNNIIDGVTSVVNEYGTVIVLEDDLVTSKYFLEYMNSGLEYYENKKTVYSISADRPPYKFFEIPNDYDYDVFVSLRPFSTGWATWKDRWDTINWSLDFMTEFLNKPEQIKAFNRGGEDLTSLLLLQRNSKIDSWAIRFVFAHFSNHAIAILPCISYIDNIGFDGTGMHSHNNESNFRKDTSMAAQHPKFLNVLYEDKRIINSFYSAYYPKKRPIWQKMVNRLSRIFKGKNIFIIKSKVYN